jgi:hypothetical protein
MNPNDSHLSQKGSKQADETMAVRQHHRMATGEKVTGMSNPNGGNASTKPTIANNQGKNY